MAQKLFITGIAGFIGSYVAREAIKQGYHVSGVDIRPRAIDGATVVEGDIRDAKLMEELTRGVDCVLNIAAVTSNVEFEEDPAYCYDVNVRGFQTVIDKAIKNGCRRFRFASSSAVYGDHATSFSEQDVIDIKQLRNHYAKTKLINEAIADSYELIYGMKPVGFRLFNVFGEGENAKGNYASMITRFINFKKNGDPLLIYGDGKQARDFVYVEDVAKVVLTLATRDCAYNLYNVGTGTAISYNEIADMVDKDSKEYVRNPLSSYQYFTQADVTRLHHEINDCKLRSVREQIHRMLQRP